MKVNIYKMNKILYFAFICAFFSCTDLEEEVFSQVSPSNFYNTPADADTAIIAIYQTMNRGLFDAAMPSLVFVASPHVWTRVSYRKSYANYTVTAAETRSNPSVWRKSYEAIFRANVAIGEIEKKFYGDGYEAERLAIIAEAKWLRAFNYFNLVRLYGEVPMPTVATSDIEGARLPRTSIANIYEQIIADLKYAETNLPDRKRTDSKLGRPVVGTAKFLLGKVYLTMAGLPLNDASKMPMAHAKIKEVIDKKKKWGYDLLDSYEDAIRIENNAERIFSIQQSRAIEAQGTQMARTWGGKSAISAGPLGGLYQGGFTQDFYESYDATDERRDVTMAYRYDSSNTKIPIFTYGEKQYKEFYGIAPNKYNDPEQLAANGQNDIIIYRYSDALLMYAEAENELKGPSKTAYQYLNEVRARGGATAHDSSEIRTKGQFRDLIYKERFWELSFEFHEIYDIRRLGKVEEVMDINPEAVKAQTPYEPRYELWPIPVSEIQTNIELNGKNNPGW